MLLELEWADQQKVGVGNWYPFRRLYFMSYGENPHYVKLPIFSEFMENSAKFMKNLGLTEWTQNLC